MADYAHGVNKELSHRQLAQYLTEERQVPCRVLGPALALLWTWFTYSLSNPQTYGYMALVSAMHMFLSHDPEEIRTLSTEGFHQLESFMHFHELLYYEQGHGYPNEVQWNAEMVCALVLTLLTVQSTPVP